MDGADWVQPAKGCRATPNLPNGIQSPRIEEAMGRWHTRPRACFYDVGDGWGAINLPKI
jgi:hypothetical protein